MPEGDTLLRARDRLDRVLRGEPVLRGAIHTDTLKHNVTGLSVDAVRVHGKNLFVDFSDGRTLHTHLRMTGSWHTYLRTDRWTRPGQQMCVVLETARGVAVCFNAPVVEFTSRWSLERTPQVASLGPDILAPDFLPVDAVTRLRALDCTLGEAVLQQRAVAGIGNIYKSESLFIHRLNPFAQVDTFPEATLASLLTATRKLMLRNVQGRRMRRTRPMGSGPAYWVYGRAGEHCLVCDGRLEANRQGDAARTTYFCPRCQNVPGVTSQKPTA